MKKYVDIKVLIIVLAGIVLTVMMGIAYNRGFNYTHIGDIQYIP